MKTTKRAKALEAIRSKVRAVVARPKHLATKTRKVAARIRSDVKRGPTDAVE